MRKLSTIMRTSVLSAALLAATAGSARADGVPFAGGVLGGTVTYQGGQVMLTFLYEAATFKNQLVIFRNATGQEFDPANAVLAFSNRDPIGTTFSFDPGALWGLEAGDALIFAICANVPDGGDVDCGGAGMANALLYDGASENSPDGQSHAVTADNCPNPAMCTFTGGQVVGFEDIREDDPPLPIDRDFNDLVFGVEQFPNTAVPEPMTMTLVATGLAGIGALRRRRRQ